jgi:hypothetical protein
MEETIIFIALIAAVLLLVMFTFYMCLNVMEEQYELLYARIKHLETELAVLRSRRSNSADDFVEEFADKKDD